MARSRISLALFIALVAIYVAGRLWHLDASCLWFDEMFSVHAAGHQLGPLLRFVALDLVHPPLFYLVLKVWISIGGESIFWLRLLPVLFSCLAIVPFRYLVRELSRDERADTIVLYGLFLLAVNGSLIKYAQEVRMYSMLMFLSVTSVWLFARYFYRGKNWLWLVIINVLMVYTHYYGWMVVGCEVAAIVIFQRMKWRRIAAMAGIVLAAFMPWVVAVIRVSGSGGGLTQNIGWANRPDIIDIGRLALSLVEPFYFQVSQAEAYSDYRVSIPIVILAAIVSAVYFAGRERCERGKLGLIFLTIFAVGPVLLAFAASWLLPQSVWGSRHLIVIFIPVFIIAATMVMDMESRWVRSSAITLAILFSGYAGLSFFASPKPVFQWCHWAPLATRAGLNEYAPVYTVEDLAAYHIWFDNKDLKKLDVKKLTGIEGVIEDKAYFLPRGFDAVGSVDIADLNDAKFWLIYRTKGRGPSAGEADRREPPVRNLLVRGYHLVGEKTIVVNGDTVAAVLFEK